MSHHRPPTVFICCLTREEFLAVWALVFLSWEPDYAIDLDLYPSPGQEGETYATEELFKRAIRYLAFRCCYEFQGCQPIADGRIYFRAPPIEPGNLAFWHQMQLPAFDPVTGAVIGKKFPHPPLDSVRALQRFAEDHNLRLSRSMLDDAVRWLSQDHEAATEAVTKRRLGSTARLLDEGMAVLGMRRVPTPQEIAS